MNVAYNFVIILEYTGTYFSKGIVLQKSCVFKIWFKILFTKRINLLLLYSNHSSHTVNNVLSYTSVLYDFSGDDESQIYNNLTCRRPSNDSQFHFCVIKEENKRYPKECDVLDENHCLKDFGKRVVGFACVNGSAVPSLCEAFAGKNKVEFTTLEEEDCKTKGKMLSCCFFAIFISALQL